MKRSRALSGANGCEGPFIHKDRAKIARDRGEYSLARRELEKALKLVPDDASMHYELGNVFLLMRKKAYAAREFSAAHGLVPASDSFLRNKMLNAMEFAQDKAVLRSRPLCLWVTITDSCNLKCIMCGINGKGEELSERSAAMIRKCFPYAEDVRWQGGEVFLSRHFESLYDEALKYPHLKQNINTNGTLIDDRWARKLARNNVSLTIAIDGVTKETYERIRVGADFERLSRAIDVLNRYKADNNASQSPGDKMTTIMSFIVMRSNYGELAGTVEFARQHAFDALQIYPIDTTFDAENIYIHENDDIIAEINETMRKVAEKAKEYGIRLLSKLPGLPAAAGTREQGNKEHVHRPQLCGLAGNNPCDIPWRHLAIDMKGTVRPSCSCTLAAGSLQTGTIEGVWNNTVMKAYRKHLAARNAAKGGGVCRYSGEYTKKDSKDELRFEAIKNVLLSENGRRGVQEKSVGDLLRFLRRKPGHAEGLKLLARFYYRDKQLARSCGKYRQLLCLRPEDGELWYELGICCLALERYAGSIEALKNALRFGHDENACRLELASAYCGAKMNDKALDEYRIVCGWDTDRPDVGARLAELRKALGPVCER